MYFLMRYFSILRTNLVQQTCFESKFSSISNQQILRFKSWKTKGNENQDEEEDSDDSDDEKFLGKGVDVRSHVCGSMRADLLLKLGLNMARNKVEEAFYESRIRINSQKILKKSVHVKVGDELDLIKGFSPTNSSFLTVGRLEILAAKAKGEGIEVKMRRSKALIIENYPDGDPWKQSE